MKSPNALLDSIHRKIVDLRIQHIEPNWVRIHPADLQIIADAFQDTPKYPEFLPTLLGLRILPDWSTERGNPFVYELGGRMSHEVAFIGGPLGGDTRSYPGRPGHVLEVVTPRIPAASAYQPAFPGEPIQLDTEIYRVHPLPSYTLGALKYEAHWVNPVRALRLQIEELSSKVAELSSSKWVLERKVENLQSQKEELRSLVDELSTVFVQVKFLEQGRYPKTYTYEDPFGDLAVGELVEVPVGYGHKLKPATVVELGKGKSAYRSCKKVYARYSKQVANG